MKEYKIVNTSKLLPFDIEDKANVNEDTRFHYRYLDLRRPAIHELLLTKHHFIQEVRKFLNKDFVEIDTPILAQESPEGARCFIVPSMIPQRYYTLPQSPQIFKQLLTISGFKYYQIAKSFRNEGARSNRQIENMELTSLI